MGLSDDLEKRLIWAKGRRHPAPHLMPPGEWCYDELGHLIRWEDYGDRNSHYGWEIDHISPTSFGGLDSYANKRPLHWRANVGLGSVARALLNQ